MKKVDLTAHNYYEMEKDICKSAGSLINTKEIEVTNATDFISIIVPKIAKEFTEEFSPRDIAENYPGLLHDFSIERLLSYYKDSKLP
jgi:protein-arginine kinase